MDTRRIWRFPASATEDSAGVLDSTSRNPTECNAVDMTGSAAAVEASRIMRVNAKQTLQAEKAADRDIIPDNTESHAGIAPAPRSQASRFGR